MREVQAGKRTLYEVDFVVNESSTEFGMSIWCAAQLSKKLELDFENGVAQFMTEEDAQKFEEHYGQA